MVYLEYMNSHDQSCVANTLKVIGSKWTILILRELCEGTHRFGELQRALVGISPKTLSARLKQLEKDGIVKKTIFPQVPLRVEYQLTERGQSLKDIIARMRDWGEPQSQVKKTVETTSATLE